MRGARSVCHCLGSLTRIIPADAGSTMNSTVYSFDIEDHPRGCGEHMVWRLYHRLYIGSSPRMRGAQLQ